ncbi:hypothetical protein [Paracidovorax citrulli]|uniref:hypothetical protein n=1 Tax=Paracidovorax citrulli TaxID=80869 RepID=UPI003FA690E6
MHSMIGNSTAREIVEIDTAENRFLSSDERVIWLAGVDPQNSRFQRIHQRASDQWTALQSPEARREDAIVEVFKFPVSEGELSVEAQLKVEKFRSDAKARYYVEFLNRSAMSEETVNSMLSAWKALSSRLKERGMNMSNVVLGGNKYDQGVDAVVMVRVGK